MVVLGAVIILVGLVFMFADKVPLIGKLPGDIVIRKKNFTFYFPFTTLVLLNLALWFIIWLFGKIKGN